MDTVWTVTQDDELIGTIDVTDIDQPWFHGAFQPTAEFDRFRERFEEELRLIEQIDDFEALNAWESLQRSLRDDGLCLRNPDGVAVVEFILHVDGDRAWFRYQDEPFS